MDQEQRLKIFIVGPAFPLRGGPAQFNENLCLELNKKYDAQIISYSLQYPNFLFPGSSQFETSGQAPQGIKIHTLINTVNPFNWIKVALFIRKEKPDFILFRFWLPFFGPSLGTLPAWCAHVPKFWRLPTMFYRTKNASAINSLRVILFARAMALLP